MTNREIAEILGVSEKTVRRDLAATRAANAASGLSENKHLADVSAANAAPLEAIHPKPGDRKVQSIVRAIDALDPMRLTDAESSGQAIYFAWQRLGSRYRQLYKANQRVDLCFTARVKSPMRRDRGGLSRGPDRSLRETAPVPTHRKYLQKKKQGAGGLWLPETTSGNRARAKNVARSN